MDIFADPVLLSRIQFALTASYHFIFVPITIGIGLIMAIFVTKAFRSKDPEDDALARMWVRIYTATFAIGVATGITMEFSFGTNWANYSRFVGIWYGQSRHNVPAGSARQVSNHQRYRRHGGVNHGMEKTHFGPWPDGSAAHRRRHRPGGCGHLGHR